MNIPNVTLHLTYPCKSPKGEVEIIVIENFDGMCCSYFEIVRYSRIIVEPRDWRAETTKKDGKEKVPDRSTIYC